MAEQGRGAGRMKLPRGNRLKKRRYLNSIGREVPEPSSWSARRSGGSDDARLQCFRALFNGAVATWQPRCPAVLRRIVASSGEGSCRRTAQRPTATREAV